MIRCSYARTLLPTLSLCLFLSIGGGRAVAHEPGPGEAHVPLRGDVNNDDALNITDAVALLDFLFGGGVEPTCLPVGRRRDDRRRGHRRPRDVSVPGRTTSARGDVLPGAGRGR